MNIVSPLYTKLRYDIAEVKFICSEVVAHLISLATIEDGSPV
jgi:hypothetical protein